MKKLLLILLFVLCAHSAMGAGYAILTTKTGAGTREDSVVVTAYTVSNSLGVLTSADSAMLVVISPKGDSVYGAKMKISDGLPMRAYKMAGASGTTRYIYTYAAATASIIGTPKYTGQYTFVLLLTNNAATQEDAFIMTANLNPTTMSFDNLRRKFFYNPTYIWITDSIQYFDPNDSTSTNVVATMVFKAAATKTKPDTTGVERK